MAKRSKKFRYHERLVKLFRVLGSDNFHEQDVARSAIDALLRKHGKTWNDVVDLLGSGPASIDAALARQIQALGSHIAKKRQDARQHIADVLARHRRTWNDLTDLLCFQSSPWTDPAAIDLGQASSSSTSSSQNFHPIDLVHNLLEQYLSLTKHEYVAFTLWIFHTHVFDRFLVTPRLVLTSPVRGCGKTTALDVASTLSAKSEKCDSITAAVTYHLIDQEHPALFVDEADNLELDTSGPLRRIFNSGHRKGGAVLLMNRGRPRKYSTHSPLALGAIGSLPLPLMHRAIVIAMERHGGEREFRRFDGNDVALHFTYHAILQWAKEVVLDPDPEMPKELRNRQADNWRPLLSIADACRWGEQAREAAVAFAKGYQDEDAQVLLLRDIRTIFNTRAVDRLPSVTLVADLNALDDAMWCEWRGIRGDRPAHRISASELARLLGPFGIRPRTIWPPNRGAGGRSAKGYFRAQFEAAWRSYCADNGTPSQGSNAARLRLV